VVISLSAALNIYLMLHYRANVRLRHRHVAMLLSYDIIHLAVLIYLTGGLANPFSLLFIVPTTISASTIKVKYTICLGLLTVLCITLLIPFHLPLPWGMENNIQLPLIYLVGVCVALVCSLSFMGVYSWKIANEAREMADPQVKAMPPENPMSADRVRWEHIQRVFVLCDRNVSETARRLNMHRRTLQRILAKRAPR